MTNKNKVEITHGGLICDNPECNWEDKTIPLNEYETYIDCPCPDCGDNILTQHDYNNILMLVDIVDQVNNSDEELEDGDVLGSYDDYISVRVNTHGTLSIDDWTPEPKNTLRSEFESEIKSTGDKYIQDSSDVNYIQWLENKILNKDNEK